MNFSSKTKMYDLSIKPEADKIFRKLEKKDKNPESKSKESEKVSKTPENKAQQ